MKAQLQQKIDSKTKPLGSLGRLEKLALQIGLLQNTETPQLRQPSLIVFAGDHGIAKEGVSAYPQEVTFQMVYNFLSGGAAVNVFARQNGFQLKVVDAGVNFDFEPHPDLILNKVGYGTKSFLKEKAMSENELKECLKKGGSLIKKEVDVYGFGEMGIANTSAASMLMSGIFNLQIEDCVGRGTGLDNAGLKRKIEVLKASEDFHRKIKDPLDLMQTYGGFEMAQMLGAMLKAGEENKLILVDGFIATSVFSVANKLQPRIINNAVFCHQSDESGHKKMLDCLGVEPLLRLGMRLGEGTGCAVAYPLIQSAVKFLNEMASFASAGVSEK